MATCTVECIAVFSCFIRSSVIKTFWILQDWKYSHTEESQIVKIVAAPNLSPLPPHDGRGRALGTR